MQEDITPTIKIKYVKKARMWCKSTFTIGNKGKKVQTQEWSSEKPDGN